MLSLFIKFPFTWITNKCMSFHELGLSNVCQHCLLLRIRYLKRFEFTKEKKKKGEFLKERNYQDQFHAANERLSIRGPVFFFSGRIRRRNFWLFLLVPIMFPICSQRAVRVLKLFPKTFSIAPQFYLIWFAQSSTLMCTNWAYLFLFCNRRCKEVLLWGIAQCSKKIGDGPINMAPSEKINKKVASAPMN